MVFLTLQSITKHKNSLTDLTLHSLHLTRPFASCHPGHGILEFTTEKAGQDVTPMNLNFGEEKRRSTTLNSITGNHTLPFCYSFRSHLLFSYRHLLTHPIIKLSPEVNEKITPSINHILTTKLTNNIQIL